MAPLFHFQGREKENGRSRIGGPFPGRKDSRAYQTEGGQVQREKAAEQSVNSGFCIYCSVSISVKPAYKTRESSRTRLSLSASVQLSHSCDSHPSPVQRSDNQRRLLCRAVGSTRGDRTLRPEYLLHACFCLPQSGHLHFTTASCIFTD